MDGLECGVQCSVDCSVECSVCVEGDSVQSV